MVIHTTEIDEENLVTLSTYGKRFMLVTIWNGEIDSEKFTDLKSAMVEYKMAVARVRNDRK